MIQTACPLDCYDACGVTVDHETMKLAGTPGHPFSKGSLCVHLNRHFKQAERIEKARVDGREVSLQEALAALVGALRESGEEALLYRGSGNLGVMQQVLEHFMAAYGGWSTEGSLCDGAGQAGIEIGRGFNAPLDLETLEKSELVVLWGRNASVTNSHLLEHIKGKKLVVIDPRETKLAKEADLHLKIRPRGDFFLAILLARFVFMEESEDKEFLKQMCEDSIFYYDFLRTFRINRSLALIDLKASEIGAFLTFLQDYKTVILVGAGVQKYSTGHEVLQAIDGLAATLGLFGKEGSGVYFLGDSMQGFAPVFKHATKRVAKAIAPFGRFKTVLVQGANPLGQMPNSTHVEAELKKVKNLAYFGLYENETSRMARIVIPACTFLEKRDLRLSYGHGYVTPMPKCGEPEFGISEYALAKELFKAFTLDGLPAEEDVIRHFEQQCVRIGEHLVSPALREVPYAEGFETDSENFEFLEEYEDEFEPEEEALWLLSPKSPHSLNSMFRREEAVFVHPNLGFEAGQVIEVRSAYGSLKLPVVQDEGLREDSVAIYCGTPGVNRLTPPIVSLEGKNACYQEVQVFLEEI